MNSLKKLIFSAVVAMSAFSAQSALAADWVSVGDDDEGNEYLYDAESVMVTPDDEVGLWVRVNFAEFGETDDGEKYDRTKELWLYDCQGNMRVDDELYFYKNKLVDSVIGEGDWEEVSSDTMGEELETIACAVLP